MPDKSLKELITKGKSQGFLTKKEILEYLPSQISDPDQIEDIMQMINDMGIEVRDKTRTLSKQ